MYAMFKIIKYFPIVVGFNTHSIIIGTTGYLYPFIRLAKVELYIFDDFNSCVYIIFIKRIPFTFVVINNCSRVTGKQALVKLDYMPCMLTNGSIA